MISLTIHQTEGRARRGTLTVGGHEIQTPAFMPVGTQASVKSLTPTEVRETGARIILNNAYHLYLRPGTELVALSGGLHRFQAWDGAILTDSGGYQIFSLSSLHTVTEDGLTFRSHIDGSEHFMSPEKAIAVQQQLGADIIMSFDQPIPWGAGRADTIVATERTHRWAERGRTTWDRATGQALFGIVQGGFEEDLRQASARRLAEMDFPGYAIGGLSVGEPKEVMWAMLDATTPEMPPDKPRYLMGVGLPTDLVRAVLLGVDLFDCVLPTRMGRNGSAFTRDGRINLRNAQYERDTGPLDPRCGCAVCHTFTRAYLRHLLKAGEILAIRSLTFHNLSFYGQVMADARDAIAANTFTDWAQEFLSSYHA